MTLNFRQLEAFRAVMQTGSVTNAAQMMAISQPAVSRLILQLEEQTRLALFDRVKNRLAATEEAKLLFREIENVFDHIGKVEAFAAQLRGGRKGQLTIASMPGMASHFLPGVIARFHEAQPDVSIALTIKPSEHVQESVATQQIDFGLAEFPIGRSGFEHEVFCDTKDVVAFPVGDALSALDVAPLGALAGRPLIAFNRGSVARARLDQALEAEDIVVRPIVECEHSIAIAEMIATGLGIGVIDVFCASAWVGRGLDWRPLAADVSFKCGLLYPSYRTLSKPARAFIAEMRAERQRVLVKSRG